MQAAGYFPTIRRSGVHVALIVAVAAMGISFGRWVVPAADSGPAVLETTRSAASGTTEASGIVQLKLAQMDARDAAYQPAASHATAAEQTRIGLKFAQMDAQDRRATAVAGVTVSPSAENHIVQLKLAQMDARDGR